MEAKTSNNASVANEFSQKLTATLDAANLNKTADEIASHLCSEYMEFSDLEVGALFNSSDTKNNERLVGLIVGKQSGFGGAKSKKLKNAKVNLKKLFIAGASGTLAISGTANLSVILITLAILLAAAQLSEALTIDISEKHAVLLYVMWMTRNPGRIPPFVAEQGLHSALNKHLNKYGRSSVTEKEMASALRELEKIGVIRLKEGSNNGWQLVEKATFQWY